MKFRWSEYRDLALELAGVEGFSGTQEARQRSAISRAYYAAFCTAREFLDKSGGEVSQSANVHGDVQRRLLNVTADKELVRVGNRLKKMHVKRKKADYDSEFPGLVHDVDSVMRQAREVIAEFEKRAGKLHGQ